MKKEILFQLDIAWQLFDYHCHNLSEEEAMWCKTNQGLQIRKVNGVWRADWPDTESYTIGPASISWIMWHIIYWWKKVLSASKEYKIITKEGMLLFMFPLALSIVPLIHAGIPICSVATFAAIQEGHFMRIGKGIPSDSTFRRYRYQKNGFTICAWR